MRRAAYLTLLSVINQVLSSTGPIAYDELSRICNISLDWMDNKWEYPESYNWLDEVLDVAIVSNILVEEGNIIRLP